MRRLFIILCLTSGFISGEVLALQSNELVSNINRAQPTQSNSTFPTLIIDRFVLSDNSESAYQRVISSTLRKIGSDNTKNIRVIWNNKQSAERIRNDLIKKGIKKNKISLIRGSRHEIYPAYVEISAVAAKSTPCRIDTAEDMMSFDPYNPCATKSNYRIQLKD